MKQNHDLSDSVNKNWNIISFIKVEFMAELLWHWIVWLYLMKWLQTASVHTQNMNCVNVCETLNIPQWQQQSSLTAVMKYLLWSAR